VAIKKVLLEESTEEGVMAGAERWDNGVEVEVAMIVGKRERLVLESHGKMDY
jgi:hypothetical protein